MDATVVRASSLVQYMKLLLLLLQALTFDGVHRVLPSLPLWLQALICSAAHGAVLGSTLHCQFASFTHKIRLSKVAQTVYSERLELISCLGLSLRL